MQISSSVHPNPFSVNTQTCSIISTKGENKNSSNKVKEITKNGNASETSAYENLYSSFKSNLSNANHLDENLKQKLQSTWDSCKTDEDKWSFIAMYSSTFCPTIGDSNDWSNQDWTYTLKETIAYRRNFMTTIPAENRLDMLEQEKWFNKLLS